MDFWSFIQANSSAVFVLAGSIVGICGTLVTGKVQSGREFRNKNTEKIIDAQIEAHKQVINLVKGVRRTSMLHDEEGSSPYPCFFENREEFNQWVDDFFQKVNSHSTWLSESVLKELVLFQSYCYGIVTVVDALKKESNISKLGAILYTDFKGFADSLELYSFRCLSKELSYGKTVPLSQWPSYDNKELDERLARSNLMLKAGQIKELTT